MIVYKFRHWGFMEGPFKGHEPTGEIVELFGMSVFEVYIAPCTSFFASSSSSSSSPSYIFTVLFCLIQLDEQEKIVKVEFFLDRGELLGGLTKGASLDGSTEEAASSCPFLKNTG